MARSNTNRNQPKSAPERRTYKEIFGAVQIDEDRTFWTRIGAAFPNKDGSWNLLFNFIPTDPQTTIQIRDPKTRDEE